MTTITIYTVTCMTAYQIGETGTRYSLGPWGHNTLYYEGYDDGGVRYMLPDGYRLCTSHLDGPWIADSKGQEVYLTDLHDEPALVTGFDSIIRLSKAN